MSSESYPEATLYHLTNLATTVSRDPSVHSGDLVVEGTRVPVEALLDSLESGEKVEEIVEGYPTVGLENCRLVAEIWNVYREAGDDPPTANRRLLNLADWSWLSFQVADRIFTAEKRELSASAGPQDLLALADPIVQEAVGRTGQTAGTSREKQMSDRGDEREEQDSSEDRTRELGPGLGALLKESQKEKPGLRGGGPCDAELTVQLTETLHSLTDAARSLRDAAEELQGHRPVHSSHARILADRVDHLAADLDQASSKT